MGKANVFFWILHVRISIPLLHFLAHFHLLHSSIFYFLCITSFHVAALHDSRPLPPSQKVDSFHKHWQEEHFFATPSFSTSYDPFFSTFPFSFVSLLFSIHLSYSVLLWNRNGTRIHDSCLCYVPLEPVYCFWNWERLHDVFQCVWLRTSTIVVDMANRGPRPAFFLMEMEGAVNGIDVGHGHINLILETLCSIRA